MTVGKAGLIAAGLVGVVALGVATSPTIRDNWSKMHAPETAVTAPVESSAPAAAKTPVRHARSSSPRAHDVAAVKAVKKDKTESNTIETVAVSVWEPEFRDRAKAVLNPGSKLEIAAADFESPVQFMTIAHAARNTQVPFMVLKDRVLNQGQSLAQAIHEFKPDLDAKAEVTRARAAAREDVDSTD